MRLNKQHLETIDALIQLGELRNRTHAISEAVKEYLKTKSTTVRQVKEVAEGHHQLKVLAAQMSTMREQLDRLQRK